MSTNSESGHAKNVSNFYELISLVSGYGAAYNPTNPAITLPQLIIAHTAALAALQEVISANTAYNNTVNTRVDLFRGLRRLTSRLVNALDSTSATAQMIKDAKTLRSKIYGRRSSAQVPPSTTSSTQVSYDLLPQHFTALFALLATEPTYAPNEPDLQLVALTTYLAQLHAINISVDDAWTNLSNARLHRNQILYAPVTGLYYLAREVKNYVKSIFGAASPQSKQLTRLNFILRN